ncbi:protein YIF1B-like isoform X2 [Pomacea canaliculata]|uniref:protein YIF1B-like isoform X2 n=1 Tax=Pomacea canaliculata TaxID=400727 RepID=UPI000D73905A|nr:protein YIF1B-like isoform X2 [Pomacea canaliculata]
MDAPSGFRQRKSGQKRRGRGGKAGGQGSRPQLFEDTSTMPPQPTAPPYNMNYGGAQYGPGFETTAYPSQQQFMGQQFFNDPMASMAMQYGTSLADQGREYVHKNIEKYVATSKLKYYFAVDTAYVGKKLGLLFFPYTHADWSIHYNQEEPVAPRYEINAPDLYIPVMAFVTYILVAGVVMGTQERFTPEQLGIQASTALVWVVIELLATMLSLYLLNLNTELKYTDIIAYAGYKFVGMIFSLLCGLAFHGTGYYVALLWFGASLTFFLVRTLRQQVLPYAAASDGYAHGTKRSLYLILSVSLLQPVLMWWLTSHIMFGKKL